MEKESERLFLSAVPEIAQLFRAVLATVQRRLERIRGRPCRASDALEAGATSPPPVPSGGACAQTGAQTSSAANSEGAPATCSNGEG